MKKQLASQLALILTFFSAPCIAEEPGDDFASRRPVFFIQANPFPSSITLGAGFGNHRVGLFGARVIGKNAYSSFGAEYAFYFDGAMSTGWYAKTYLEYRTFSQGLEVNSTYSEQKKEWTSEELDHHTSTHGAALIGYQYMFAAKFFCDFGLGWQYNSHPVNIGSTSFGVGQSIKERHGATAELGMGHFF